MQRYLIPIQNCNKYFVFLIFFIRFVKIEKNDELNEVIFQYCKQEEVFCMCRIIIKLHKLGYLAKSESYMLQGKRTDNVLESSRFYNKTKIKNKWIVPIVSKTVTKRQGSELKLKFFHIDVRWISSKILWNCNLISFYVIVLTT